MIRFPNGGELFDFQRDASEWLLNQTTLAANNETLIVKAPTGSGKTIILLDFIDRYLDYTSNKTSFVWFSIGAGELEEQSKEKLDKLLPNRNSKTLSDTLRVGFEGNDITFINWEAVNRTSNRATRLSEAKNIIDRITEAHKNDIDFILIVDEEHRSNTNISAEFMAYFSAKSIIRVSATPIKNDAAKRYEIPEHEVISSGLITRAMYVNDEVSNDFETDMMAEHAYLIDLAIKKRIQIQDEYNKLNKKIRPLVIIQFPDSSSEYIEEVEQLLIKRGYSYENGLLAKWLSEEKINLSGIEKNNASPLFLIWKQALSTGWDCPRAKILVKLRAKGGDSFEIQTIGRIRRMPEARHYNNDLLDNCFMYTLDEEWKENVLKDEMAFERHTLNIKDEGRELNLIREVRDPSSSILGERDVRSILSYYLVSKYKLRMGSRLPIELKAENKEKLENDGWKFGTKITYRYLQGKFVRTSDLISADSSNYRFNTQHVNTHEHGRDVMHIINELHRVIPVSDSVIRAILKTLFHREQYRRQDNLLALDNREWYAFIINNRERLKEVFHEIKAQDFSEYSKYKQSFLELDLGGLDFERPKFKEKNFKIPLSEKYSVKSIAEKKEVYEKNIYHGYPKNIVHGSKIEKEFEDYCETSSNVEWIYKNGDKGDRYFSIGYSILVKKASLFYPDYILKMKNGDVWIIETKGGEVSGRDNNLDEMAQKKFKALKEYIQRHPNLKWGFVRDREHRLYLNNTEWSDNMIASSSWEPIERFF